VTDPSDALRQAREAADARRARGDYDEAPPSLDATPADRISPGRLVEWSLIEPDPERVYSTRKFGGGITFFKRLMIRGMRQYLSEGHAQQSRYNAQATAHILNLEQRLRELEDELRKK
jgi:hypothetical protein